MGDIRIPVLIFIAVLSLGYALTLNVTTGNRIDVPVSGEEALMIVKNEPTASSFISENFGEPSDRIERVALIWDIKTDTYRWEIEIQERTCGCMLNETEGVTILRALLDPVTGQMYNLSTRVGVPEDQIKREACEKGCHIP